MQESSLSKYSWKLSSKVKTKYFMLLFDNPWTKVSVCPSQFLNTMRIAKYSKVMLFFKAICAKSEQAWLSMWESSNDFSYDQRKSYHIYMILSFSDVWKLAHVCCRRHFILHLVCFYFINLLSNLGCCRLWKAFNRWCVMWEDSIDFDIICW